MSIPFIIVSVLVILSCIAIISLILAQKKNASAGFGAAMTGMGSGDSYWSGDMNINLQTQMGQNAAQIADYVSKVIVDQFQRRKAVSV